MSYTPNIWVDREGTTRYFETIDTDGAKIFTPDYSQLTEIGTPVNADHMNYIEEGIANNDKRITALEEGTDPKQFLNKTQITNCITEIPQNIKLELNDGVLTLKAGSKVYVPNGFEADGTTPKFDYVDIESDITYGETFTSSIACYATYNQTRKVIEILSQNDTNFSYDSTINKVIHSDLSGHNLSFPIALVHRDTTGIGSLDQTFNGFGYIGSTIFVLPNVKGLVPNGRNEDGSLNNIEVTVSKVSTSTYTTTFSGTRSYVLGSNQNIYTGAGWYYDEKANYNRTADGNISSVIAQNPKLVLNAGKIESFEIKLPFRAVDYNDLTSVVPTGTVISSASSATPTGYLYCNGAAVSRTAYADLFGAIGTTYGTGDGSTTFNLPNYSNYNFVTSNSVAVKGTGKALGITNGSNYYGLQGSNSNGLYPSGNGYGVNVGTSGMSPQNLGSIAMGVTTDASKSGLNGTVSTAKINWYIKY